MVKDIQLQDRDMKILEHIERFRITTRDVLHGMFYQGKQTDAVTSTLRRLRQAEYISSEILKPPRTFYYHLTRRATRMIGLPASFADSLGEQALPTRYAILRFCCGGQYRPILRTSEFVNEFPECCDKHVPKEPYYYDSGDVPRLSYLMVDLGADAGRTVRKCRRAFGERLKVKGFRRLIEGKAFSVTVLTQQGSKKAAIEAALKRAKDFKYPIRIEAIPELMGMV
jgi:hypothetical protein